MALHYYTDVPIKYKCDDGSVRDALFGFFLSDCYIDPYLPGQLVCDYACHTCYELQDRYKDVKSIEELKVLLVANGIFPTDVNLKRQLET